MNRGILLAIALGVLAPAYSYAQTCAGSPSCDETCSNYVPGQGVPSHCQRANPDYCHFHGHHQDSGCNDIAIPTLEPRQEYMPGGSPGQFSPVGSCDFNFSPLCASLNMNAAGAQQYASGDEVEISFPSSVDPTGSPGPGPYNVTFFFHNMSTTDEKADMGGGNPGGSWNGMHLYGSEPDTNGGMIYISGKYMGQWGSCISSNCPVGHETALWSHHQAAEIEDAPDLTESGDTGFASAYDEGFYRRIIWNFGGTPLRRIRYAENHGGCHSSAPYGMGDCYLFVDEPDINQCLHSNPNVQNEYMNFRIRIIAVAPTAACNPAQLDPDNPSTLAAYLASCNSALSRTTRLDLFTSMTAQEIDDAYQNGQDHGIYRFQGPAGSNVPYAGLCHKNDEQGNLKTLITYAGTHTFQ